MSLHQLQGRQAAELLWFQRRQTIQAVAAWLALGGSAGTHAQVRSNVVELEGDALLNGQRLDPSSTVQSGDVIETGPQSRLVCVVGDSAFHVRQNSLLVIDRGATLNSVSMLRLLKGAVISVWGQGAYRRILTPTLVATVRGGGTYTEILANSDRQSYFCSCYGGAEVATHGDKRSLVDHDHQGVLADQQSDARVALNPSRAINHSDEELEFLARMVKQQTAWQARGYKGYREGGSPI